MSGWQRVSTFEAVNNFRDYGGWRAADGARVVTARLFRSAHLARATEADLGRIASLDITTVTDLRHPREQREQPSAWIGKLPLSVIDSPDNEDDGEHEAPHVLALRQSDFTYEGMVSFLASHYGEMPYDSRHISVFSRYFDALATCDGAVLVHCAAGKDRTGILVALTHHLLGVHPDDAMEDYMLTNTAGNVAERLPHLKPHMEATYGRPISDEALMGLLSVRPDFIRRCWAALKERTGSVDAYLTTVLGIDDAKRDRIRERFLA